MQQGDPLCPFLFSLVLCSLLDNNPPSMSSIFQSWYLDDGSIVGPRTEVSNFYNFISSYGPRYGLFLNPSKCELFWPSGNQTFPEFESKIWRLSQGVSLLGSPLWGPDAFFADSVQTTVEKAKTLHQLLPYLQDPQVALHLLRSCLV